VQLTCRFGACEAESLGGSDHASSSDHASRVTPATPKPKLMLWDLSPWVKSPLQRILN